MQHKHLQFPEEALSMFNNINLDHYIYKNRCKEAQMSRTRKDTKTTL